MQKWEFKFVSCDHANNAWRPKYVNGQELRDWKRNPTIYDYANQLGAEGWELVNTETLFTSEGNSTSYKIVLKREL